MFIPLVRKPSKQRFSLDVQGTTRVMSQLQDRAVTSQFMPEKLVSSTWPRLNGRNWQP